MSQPSGYGDGQIYWAPPPADLQYGPSRDGPRYGAPYGSVPGGSPAGDPGGPSPGGPGPGGPSRLIVALIAAAVVVAAVGVAAFAISQGTVTAVAGSAVPAPTTPSASPRPSASGSAAAPNSDEPPRPTGSTPPPDGPSVAGSQAVATRYFNDLNTKNPTDARTLLCDDAKPDFDTTVNDPDNDFTFTWSAITYRGAGAVDSDVTVLTYDTTLSRNSSSDQITVLLYFINEDGVKLCGEDTV